MKSYIVSLAKGINHVSDKAVIEPGFATCLDNIDLRSGSIRPFFTATPVIGIRKTDPENHLSDAGNDVRSIYWSRGMFILSNNERDYTSEYVGESDRIFFTEYGSIAQKIVSGVQVPLGLRRPEIRPTATVESSLGIRNFTVTEESGGNFTKDKVRSYRIAISTDDGVLPPTNKVSVKVSDVNKSLRLTWSRSSFSELAAREILIFAGDDDKERRIASVPSTQTYYLDNGAESGTAGELASIYDLDLDFQYCYTFVRNVRGMEDESGPSPLGLNIKSNNVRRISFSATTDGFFSSDNVQNIDTNIAISPLEADPDLNEYQITSFSTDVDTGMVRVGVSAAGKFSFLPGGYVKFIGVTGVSATTAYEILLPDDAEIQSDRVLQTDWQNYDYFLVDAPITIGQAITIQSVRRDMVGTISSVTLDNNSATVIITMTEDHCFWTGQKVTFTTKSESFDVVVSPVDRTKLFILGGSFDRALTNGGWGTTVTGHAAYVGPTVGFPNGFRVNAVMCPYDGDAIYIDTTNVVSPASSTIKGLFRARTGGLNAVIVDSIVTASITTTLGGTINYMYVPHNDYIYSRRLYRIGDTGEFLKVKDAFPWEETLVDARPTISLNEPITSNYSSNGIDVTFDVPPTGMVGIVSHYDMKFAIYENTVRWTENGYPDAWAESFSQDFKYRPLALVSWDQGVLVFCEDAVYILVGNTATGMSVSITSAIDGCIAPRSVQATNNGVFYLSKRGIMLYRNGSAECVTDARIVNNILLGTSGLGDRGDIGEYYYWNLSRHSYFYQNLAASDQLLSYIDGDPGPNVDTLAIPGIITEIKSFYVNGRYFIYWSSNPSRNLINLYNNNGNNARDTSNYALHTTIMIDTQAAGFPITTLGFKPRDVFVTENEETYFLADTAGENIGGGV